MAQLSFVAPELLAATPVPTWTRHAPSITILDANIDKSLQFEVGYRDAIKRYRPDVVAMEEFTPLALQGMMRSGALRGFPYRCAAPASGDDRRRGRPRSRSGNDLAQWSNRAGFRPDRSRIDWSPSRRHLDRFETGIGQRSPLPERNGGGSTLIATSRCLVSKALWGKQLCGSQHEAKRAT